MKYKIIAGLMLMVIFFLGCSKDFLNRPLENNSPAESTDYSNLSLMYQPVSNAYRVMGANWSGWIDACISAIRADDIVLAREGADPGLYELQNYNNNIAVQDFWGLKYRMWWDKYYIILQANNALGELKKFAAHIPGSDAQTMALNMRYRAEARYIRAYVQYMLTRWFGSVPILKTNIPDDLANLEKSSVEDIKKFVITEMDTCIASLEDIAPNKAARAGGITKYTALMLKSKAAMDLAGNNNGSPYWDVVLDCTNQIISSGKFSLYPDYYQLFKIPGKLCDESIYELQYSTLGQSSGDYVYAGRSEGDWGTFFSFQGPIGDQRGSPIKGVGCWIIPSQAAVDFLTLRYDTTRLKTAIEYCGIDGNPNTYKVTPAGDTVYGNSLGIKYFNGKAYTPRSQMTPGRGAYGSNNNVRIFRYAEVLLMNAEAKIRKGQNGDSPINLVRQRVRLSPLVNTTLQQLMDERRAELICEWWGERFNDLIRTEIAAQVLPGFVKGQSEHFPIPIVDIDRNPNLK